MNSMDHQMELVKDMTSKDKPEADGSYRVKCMNCGKSVSSPLRDPIIIRAYVICPECIEKDGFEKSIHGW